MKKILSALCAVLILTACGSSKALQGGTTGNAANTEQKKDDNKSLDYIRQVSDNAVYTKNIVSNIDCSLSAMGKEISLGGKLQMRKNEVIRITLTAFGLMEVGRIEFAPDYVLIVNRIEKQYVRAKYSDVDFLKNNGMDFYTLQSLFWNELFIPSKKTVVESDLSAFTVGDEQQQRRAIKLHNGSLDFQWDTNTAAKLIENTEIAYRKGTREASTMTFNYGTFVAVGAKKFPSKEVLTFNSNAAGTGKIVLALDLNRITTEDGWDAKTTLSAKYTEVSADNVLSKLMAQ